jgi:hypothetical protein
MAGLTSTEHVKIDLRALMNFHFQRSLCRDCPPVLRKWHRQQSRIVRQKLDAVSQGKGKGNGEAFKWETFCEESRRKIAARELL